MSWRTRLVSRHNGRGRRLIIALVAALTLVMLSATVVLAQTIPNAEMPMSEPQDPVALDRFCISGEVINHAEEPLVGWTITAQYEGTNGDYSNLTDVSDAEGKFRFNLPGTGRWGLTIDTPERWEGVTKTQLAVHVGFGNSACVKVRFKMRELIMIKVIKIDENHTPQPSWIITATPGPGNTFGAVQTGVTDENGEVELQVTPGAWVITEAPPAGVVWWRPISPADGVHRLVAVGPGPYTIRFKNILEKEPKTCINVFKYDVPPDSTQDSFGLAGWPIQVLLANGQLADAGVTDSFGQVTFTDLPYGPYIVEEVMQPGWEPASPSRFSVVLTSRDDGCKDIIFYNKQLPKGFCFEGRKIDKNGGFGIPDWEISASPVESGGYKPDPVLTDGEGRYRFYLPLEDYRIPGSVYEVSETVPDGWTPVSPTSYLVTLPDNADICVQVPDFVNQQTRHEETVAPCAQCAPPAHQGGCRATHVVQRGESVYKIAAHYNVPSQGIFGANPWIKHQRNYWLFVGQKVCIP